MSTFSLKINVLLGGWGGYGECEKNKTDFELPVTPSNEQ